MTNVIARNHPFWNKYSQFKKCGEITTSVDGQDFGLNCVFCEMIGLSLEAFVSHIQVSHINAVKLLYAAKCDQRSAMMAKERNRVNEVKIEAVIGEAGDGEFQNDLHGLDEIKVEAEALQQPNTSDVDSVKDPFEEDEAVVKYEISHDKEENNMTEECASESDDVRSDTSERTHMNSDVEDNHKIELLLLDNRALLMYIIEFYKTNPILWDREHYEFSHNHKKRRILMGLSTKLKNEFNVDMGALTIRSQFSQLRKVYREELQRSLRCNGTSVYTSNLWCFKNLEFLNDYGHIAGRSAVPFVLPPEQLRELVTIYKEHPCLWDLDHEENRDRTRKSESLRKMLEDVTRKLNMKMTLKQLLGRIKRLKKIYASNKRRRLELENTNRRFQPSSEYYSMLGFLEDSVGPFRCEKCAELIRSHDKYRVHMAAHEGAKPFPCKICNKGMTTLGNLQIHMRRHTGETQFLCTECGKGFPSSADLNSHSNIHSSTHCNYVCHLCGKAFSTKSLFNRHKAKHDPKNYAYKCSVCSKSYLQKYKYREHMNSHMNIRSCVCNVCGKGFFANKTLLQHKKTHAESKPYSCKICGKDYARAASYYSHMKSQHSIEK